MAQNETFALIKQLTGQANVLTVPVAFIRLTGRVESALFLSQIVYWTGKTEDGWFYKSASEWEQEIGLTVYGIRKATNTLVAMGVLETKLRKVNGAPTLFYRLKIDAFLKILIAKTKNGFCENEKSIDSSKTQNPIKHRLPKTTYITPPTGGNPVDSPTVIQKSKTERPRDRLFDALADVCRVNPKLMTVEQRGAMNQTLSKLRQAGHTPEQIKSVGEWWHRCDWRGRRGQAPRPHEIREVWDQAFVTVPVMDEHPNAYRPGKMIL